MRTFTGTAAQSHEHRSSNAARSHTAILDQHHRPHDPRRAEVLDMRPTSDARRPAAPPEAREALRSTGQPLDVATRAYMEPRFGHDFSRVRVHFDSRAAASARDVDALAYTVGRDIVFGEGQFAPYTDSGRRLLAHELAHTIQQHAAAEQPVTGDLGAGGSRDPHELEAEAVAASVLEARSGASRERPALRSVRTDTRPILQRQPRPDPKIPDIEPVSPLPKKEEGVAPGQTTKVVEAVCKPPSDIPLPCRPKGVSVDEFLKLGPPSDALGFTKIDAGAQIVPPEVLTQPAAGGKGVVIQKTEAKPVPCTSSHPKAGRIWRTISIDASNPRQRSLGEQCGRTYLEEFRITGDGEKKLAEVELEHCTDFKHAFDISLGCYAAIINNLAKTKKVFSSQQAAVDAVAASAGRKPDTWAQRYIALIELTAERDRRQWHTAVEPKGPGLELEVDRQGRCRSRLPTEVNDKSSPKVGKHRTADLIT